MPEGDGAGERVVVVSVVGSEHPFICRVGRDFCVSRELPGHRTRDRERSFGLRQTCVTQFFTAGGDSGVFRLAGGGSLVDGDGYLASCHGIVAGICRGEYPLHFVGTSRIQLFGCCPTECTLNGGIPVLHGAADGDGVQRLTEGNRSLVQRDTSIQFRQDLIFCEDFDGKGNILIIVCYDCDCDRADLTSCC